MLREFLTLRFDWRIKDIFRIVMYKMSEKLGEIDKMRKLMKKSMKNLVENDPETFLNRAVDCHLRSARGFLNPREKLNLKSHH